MRSRIWLAWSSGKDSAWTLHRLRQSEEYEVVGLLVTLSRPFRRVSMHGVREEVLELQAAAVGLPLIKVWLPYPCPNEAYEAAMRDVLEQAEASGISGVAFGDLFLQDVRQYREEQMSRTRLRPLFPLWQEDTAALAREMVRSGLRAYVVCVNPARLDPKFAGASFDEALLAQLPDGVDPCGERGEFHTLVVDGPMFRHPVCVRRGETVERDGFLYTDFLPLEAAGGNTA